MPTQEQIDIAKQKLDLIKGFYIHAFVFVLVITILAIVDFRTPESWWVQWVILGWGSGVLGHALLAFGNGANFLDRWEEKKMKELIEAEEKSTPGQQ